MRLARSLALVCSAACLRHSCAAVVGHHGADDEAISSLVRLGNGEYRLNISVHPAGSYAEEERSDGGLADEMQVVITSWALVAITGSYQGTLKMQEFPWLAQGLRSAIADSIGVCRSAVSIADMRAANVNFVLEPVQLPRARARQQTQSLVHRIESLVRSEEPDPFREHVNLTRVRAVYEVRVFDEMRLSAAEVARRVDRLQMYSRFSDLSRLLLRTLALPETPVAADGILLDDVGYASRRVLPRVPLSEAAVADCVEEVLLRDARTAHQYIVAISLFLAAVITCIGSTVFTIKHPSPVPSRMNPLVGQGPG